MLCSERCNSLFNTLQDICCCLENNLQKIFLVHINKKEISSHKRNLITLSTEICEWNVYIRKNKYNRNFRDLLVTHIKVVK